MAKFKDKELAMPAPKMAEEEEMDLMELGEDAEMLTEDEEAMPMDFSEYEDSDLIAELEERGYMVEEAAEEAAEGEDMEEMDLEEELA